MAVTTYEGIVEKGKIRLKAGVKLPENANVYVVVLREDAARFKIKVSREKPNAHKA